jgi:two-component system, cell cycle response regulator
MPGALKLAYAAMGVAVLGQVAHGLFDLGHPSLDGFIENGLYSAVEVIAVLACAARVVRRKQDRGAWLLVTIGLLTWTAGDAVWTLWLDNLSNPPEPSIADALYLLWYPSIYVALGLLMRAHFRHAGVAVWLDGLVVGTTAAAIAAALILPAILGASEGNAAADAVNLAYPVGDLLLLMFIALGFALAGWRPGRQWTLLGVGIAISALADMIYLYQSARGTYTAGHLLDSMWPISMFVLAIAAWQQPAVTRERAGGRPHTVILPAVSGMTALGLLVSGTLHPLTHVAVALATVALLAASARAALTYIENARILRAQSLYAVTDALTGLGNRRRLNEDLERFVIAALEGRPATLAFFDLNGFKRYNDTFGHGAGDALLARLAASLALAVEGAGHAYRLGGDEFCVLLDGRVHRGEAAVERAEAALTEHGSGFTIDASCGLVALPAEADTATLALALADKRMYEEKGRSGRSSHSQIQGVLMRLLGEREPVLHNHLRDVGVLALAVGRHFDLDNEQLEELRRAAELHDIGKLAVPDEILRKAGPLTDEEAQFMRQHTLIGERVLDVAPALGSVARLVRSTHERWDGSGYPDGLAGEAIPIGSRIIAACDAYTAMTSERPHEPWRSPLAAQAELRSHAGTQFDPAVVEAICAHLSERPKQRSQPHGELRTRARVRAQSSPS